MEQASESDRGTPPDEGGDRRTPARILLIDDDEQSYVLCRAHLEHQARGRYSLDWASTFEAGYDAIQRNEHDLYVVDVFLGDGPNGIELVERVRAQGNRSPMVVLTKYPRAEDDRRNMLAGGTEYLDKQEITGPLFERTLRYSLERARSERRIRESEAQYRFQATLLDAVGQAVVATDPVGVITYWNEAAMRLYGWSAEEAQGKPLADILGTESMPESLPDVVGAEVSFRRKDGSQVPAFVTNSLIRDSEGRVVGTVAVSSDLTERRNLETQLLQSTRLEAVGRLAGGVAHDFNNILTTILGFSQLALDEISENTDVAGYIGEALRSARRAQDLTRQLLAFSRQQLLQPQVIDLGQIMSEMERMLGRTLGEDIRLEVHSPAEAWVRVDPGQAEQVLLNLALNARHAMPRGGRLSITTALLTLDAHNTRDFGFTPSPGRYVRLTVSDTGVGMEPEVLARVFEPFFTTRQDSGGSGLGLAMVYGIVKQSGGYIRASSKPGVGSTFDVYLPECVDTSAAGKAPARMGETIPGHGRVVLVIEDEDPVRAMVRKVLQRNGYEVMDAPDGQKALDLARGARERLDLILSDVVMPGMSGRDVVEALASEGIRPRVIYMSGYTRDEMILKGLQEATFTFLPKPFVPAELLNIVAEQFPAEV